MLKILKIWLALTVISWGLYIPYYMISNDAVDAVEELTLWDFTPVMTPAQWKSYPEVRASLTRLGLDIELELEDALEENELLSEVEIDYLETEHRGDLLAAAGTSLVEVTAQVEGRFEAQYELQMVFAVQEKVFPVRPKAHVLGLLQINVSDGKTRADVGGEDGGEMLFISLFSKNETIREEAVGKLIADYHIKVAPQ